MKNKTSITVSQRLGLGVSLLIGLTLVVAVLGFLSARQNESVLKGINEGSVKPLALAWPALKTS